MKERNQLILCFLVDNYIKTGEPVGSRTISKMKGANFSAATIRNIMLDLTDLGLISQPHTSAGRIPTNQGYRFYVNLMENEKFAEEVTFSEQELVGVDTARLEDLLRNTTKIIANLSDLTGIASSPKPSLSHMKLVEFVRLSDQQILVILVTQSGMVTNKIIPVRENFKQDVLDSISLHLNDLFKGKTLAEIRFQLASKLAEEKNEFNSMLGHTIRLGKKAFDITDSSDLYLYGQTNLIHYPEFLDPENLENVYLAFEEKTQILEVLGKTKNPQKTNVFIGSEINCHELGNCSVISANYSADNYTLGSIGIIGPTRMDYQKNKSIVENISKELSQQVTKFLA
ncbi:MAG: heat-inducible transcriptional repressor [bacterium]|jgi:heat-inducible transcriptional repressor